MSRRASSGRGVAQLLADFGHDLPVLESAPRPPRDPRLFRYASRRGRFERDRGWSAAKAPVSQWRMTADQAPALWPWIATPGLPPTGSQLGIDVHSGGAFYFDPNRWVLDPMIPVTNNNIFVAAKPGRGKSTLVKILLVRHMAFGYRALIAGDPKDEYEPLCRAFGVEPFAIGPGMSARINPITIGPLGHGWERLAPAEAKQRAAVIFSRWLMLIRGLVGAQRIGDRQVPYGPNDEAVVEAALRTLTGYASGSSHFRETTIPELWYLLDNPTEDLVDQTRYASARHFLDETRTLRNALGQLVKGALAGLFDGHTTIDVDWTAPIQSLSLSRLEPLGDEAVGIALTCLNSWSRGMREVAPAGDMRIIVRDEAWRQLRLGVDAVKSFDADLRLSRSTGDIQFAIMHKPSDMLSAGDVGSQAQSIAKDLMLLADTKILGGQDRQVAEELDDMLDLGDPGREAIAKWAMSDRGRFLWSVGDLKYAVQTVVHPAELQMTDTNARIAGAA